MFAWVGARKSYETPGNDISVLYRSFLRIDESQDRVSR
jgi:hypothetical protein